MQPDHPSSCVDLNADAYINHTATQPTHHPSINSDMAVSRALVLGVLLAIAVANAEAASVVVGQVKCTDCTRKNMKAEEAFKGKR